MKNLILFAAVSTAIVCHSETNSVEEFYTPDIVKLLEAKYWRDVSNESGRVYWHGTRKSSFADPSNMVTVTVYEDGRVFKDRANVTTPKDSIDKANKRLPRTVNKQGVPAKLAEARERRAEEKSKPTVVTSKIVKPGDDL